MRFLLGVERWLERSLERLFKGAPSPIQPVALGRELIRQLEAGRRLSISAVYVPNVYLIQLSPEDSLEMAPFRDTVGEELIEHVRSYAERNHYRFLGPPQVRWEEASTLARGHFRISCTYAAAPGEAKREEKEGLPARTLTDQTVVFRPGAAGKIGEREEVSGQKAAPRLVILTGDAQGQSFLLRGNKVTVGRGPENDVVLADPNVSRRHATIFWDGQKAVLVDEKSTNGTWVNGERISAQVTLSDGDRIRMGLTELRYEEGRMSS